MERDHEAAVALQPARAKASAILVALRPFQWPKNLIVYAALVFSAGDAWELRAVESWDHLLARTTALFVAWCLASSAVYLVNDVRDAPLDRFHPTKRHRPVATGEVAPGEALAIALLLGAAGLVLAATTAGWEATAVLAGYLAGMSAYSAVLKHVPIADVAVLTGGVIARAVSGALAIAVHISPWLYVCSGIGAWFLAVSKRWAELRSLGEEAENHRPALARYPPELLDQMLSASAGATVVTYALYSIESANVPENGAMALTIPFVAYGIFRYLYLLAGPRREDAPDRILFTDPQLLGTMAGFVGVALAVLLLA